MARNITYALVGNPNSGKTTLFNALTGSNQTIGNWPGVTVEKKTGKLIKHNDINIIDLPGLYSLSANSIEEVIASDALTENPPDGIINIIDGTNLERNLYMTTQLLDLGLPLILAINMNDELESEGLALDPCLLANRLGCPVVAISALKGEGLDQLVDLLISTETTLVPPSHQLTYGEDAEALVSKVINVIGKTYPESQIRYWAFRSLETNFNGKLSSDQRDQIKELIAEYEKSHDDDIESTLALARYTKIDNIVSGSIQGEKKSNLSITDRIDKIVTNRWLAIPIFVIVMIIVYGISVTTLGGIATDWTNDVLFGEIIPPAVEGVLQSINVAPWLESLIVEGIIGGVGAVLGFVPQMLILFFMLAVLEASGYMARIAFIMDRIFRKWGLSGKSFIPLLIGSGCSVPGIMASRTIEEEKDRRMTVIVTSFIPCSAKLPVIALFAGALMGGAWWVAPSAYFLGIAAVVVSGLILKKTKRFEGDPAPFVMELPNYRMPSLMTVLRSTWERGSSFIKKAGTIILLSSIVIWGLTRYGIENGTLATVAEIDNSFMAIIGNSIGWIFTPLGWHSWQSAVATITGLVAKENVVSTFGILFGMAEVSEAGNEIWPQVAAHFGMLGGFSFLMFNLLCIPCFAAVGAIKREMNSASWTWFAIGYQTVFAYAVSFVFYQIALWVTTGGFDIGIFLALVVLGLAIYLAVRKPTNKASAQLAKSEA